MALSLIIILFTIAGILFLSKDGVHGFAKFRYMISKVPSFNRIAYPLIGHTYLLVGSSEKLIHAVIDLAHDFQQKTKQKLGVLWFGPEPLIFILDPSGAEVILKSSRHMKKSFMYRFIHPWLGTGLLTSHGEKWKQRRRLITPSFHFSILQDFLDVMNEQSQTFVKSLKNNCSSTTAEKQDVGKAITMCALDIICETAMGQTVNAQENHDSDYIKALYRSAI